MGWKLLVVGKQSTPTHNLTCNSDPVSCLLCVLREAFPDRLSHPVHCITCSPCSWLYFLHSIYRHLICLLFPSVECKLRR